MPLYWNFREILSVEPTTDTCAAKATSTGQQCLDLLNSQKRLVAGLLLDGMDREKTLSLTKLTELAEAMLCGGVHNSPTWPRLNQVGEVRDKWHAMFEDHVERGKQKAEKLERTQSIVRQTPEIKSISEGAQATTAAFKEMERKIKLPAVEKTITVEKGKVDQASVLNTVPPVHFETKATCPFTDDEDDTQRKSSIFEENLRRISETNDLDDGKPLSEVISCSSAGLHPDCGKRTDSKMLSFTSAFTSPPDGPLTADTQAEEGSTRVYSSPRPANIASAQQLATRKIAIAVKKLPSRSLTAMKESPSSSSTNIISTPIKLKMFVFGAGAGEKSMQAFKSELPELAQPLAVEAELSRSVADSSVVDTEVKPKPWYEFTSGKQVSFACGPLLSKDPLPLRVTLEQEPISVLNPSSCNDLSLPMFPETPAAPASSPPPTPDSPRVRKKVPFRGKNIMVLLPCDKERGQKGKAPMPMTETAVEAKLKGWEQLGYCTTGFNLSQSDKIDDEIGERQTRSLWPQVVDMHQERQQRPFRVSIPDRREWDTYLRKVSEAKLRAWGIIFDEEDDDPTPTISSAASNISRQASMRMFRREENPFAAYEPSTDTTGRTELLPTSASGSTTSLPHATLSTGTSSKEPSSNPNTPTHSGPRDVLPSIATLGSEATLVTNPLSTADKSNTRALLGMPNQKPLPTFNIGFTPRYSNPLPRAKLPSSSEAKIPTIPFDVFPFAFGSQYEVPPKSFDFNTWSKIASAARLPEKFFFREGFGSARKSDEEIVEAAFDELKEEQLESGSGQAEEGLAQQTSVQRAPVTLADESDMPKDEYESISEPPRTPTTSDCPCANKGSLTPEATPERMKTSQSPNEDRGSSEAPREFSRKQKVGTSTLVAEENVTIASEAIPEMIDDLAQTQTKEGSFGQVTIISERRYKTNISAEPINGLLTPPESPQNSRRLSPDAESFSETHTEVMASSLIAAHRAGSPAVIRRKPLPSPWETKPAQHEPVICDICGQRLEAGQQGCHCGFPEQLEWENQRVSTTSRLSFGRRMRKGAAKKVTEMKTKTVTRVTKMADSVVARLEPDGRVDQ